MLPLLFSGTLSPKFGTFYLTILDVGQGLSVVVRTMRHVLLYDTGPKFGSSLDAGKSVIAPYLRTLRTKSIDMMVISHGDNDHSGGAFFVLQTFPVKQIKTSVPVMFAKYGAMHCHAGENWSWDGVRFMFLNPSRDAGLKGNNASCVLKIVTGRESVLLTGDIEKEAERLLIKSFGNKLLSSIVVVPHHGSKTSSTISFVRALHSRYAVFSVGYYNKFGFPNRSVIARYSRYDATELETASSGAITFKILPNKIVAPIEYRKIAKHYWNAL